MLHFGPFAIPTEIFVLFSFLVVLFIQLLLCFKVNKKIIRLLPVRLFLTLTIVFSLSGYLIGGWDGLKYWLLSVYSAIFLLGSGIGWGIWTMMKSRNSLKQKNDLKK